MENTSGYSTMGASDFGARGKRSEKVGTNAARDLTGNIHSKAAVDSYLADQIIPYMAIAANQSNKTHLITAQEITNHIFTNLEICRLFYPHLNISCDRRDNHHLISVKQR